MEVVEGSGDGTREGRGITGIGAMCPISAGGVGVLRCDKIGGGAEMFEGIRGVGTVVVEMTFASET